MLPLSTKPAGLSSPSYSSGLAEFTASDQPANGIMAILLRVTGSSQPSGKTASFEKFFTPSPQQKEAATPETTSFPSPMIPTINAPTDQPAPLAVDPDTPDNSFEGTADDQPTTEPIPALIAPPETHTSRPPATQTRSASIPDTTSQLADFQNPTAQSGLPAAPSTSVQPSEDASGKPENGSTAAEPTAVAAFPRSQETLQRSALSSQSAVSGSTPPDGSNETGGHPSLEIISGSTVSKNETVAAPPLPKSGPPTDHPGQPNSHPSREVSSFKTTPDNPPAPVTVPPSAQTNLSSSISGITSDQTAKILPGYSFPGRPNGTDTKTEVKISPLSPPPSSDGDKSALKTNIESLNISNPTTNKSIKPVGIDVANRKSSMPFPSVQVHSESSEAKTEALQSAFSAPNGLKDGAFTLPPEPVPAARQVLGTILKIVDQPEHAEQTKVDLHFSFGKDTLAVRVGLQGGEVHTTFQSSSAELRNTLANQWQGFTEQLPENTRALLDPVFKDPASSPAGSSNHQESSGQQSASRHRATPFQHHTTHPQDETNDEPFTSSPRPAPSSTARQLLNTLA